MKAAILMEEVVLVNERDEATGVMEKMEAHRSPILHRAFSVFLFNSKKQMLLQQRAHEKYHSGGLWTNACCSHPRPGEAVAAAAQRRLNEELGINAEVKYLFDFIYQAEFENGLFEYEFDHVFTGIYDGAINPDDTEVAAYSFKSIQEIRKDLIDKPHMYTAWFKIALPRLEQHLNLQEAD